jgi:diguanylate cyclase (GGDEF)-like protein/PAS domain S-box-containing protein
MDYGIKNAVSTLLLRNLISIQYMEFSRSLSAPSFGNQNDMPGISDQLIRNIFEYAPLGMALLDASLNYVLVNSAFCEMLGYSKDDLKTLNPLDITYSEDKDVSRERLEALVSGEINVYQIEKRYIKKNGSSVWMHLTISMIRNPDGDANLYVAQIQDVSAQKALEDKQRLATAVFNYSNQGIMVTDTENRIIAVNPAFTELTGYSSDEVLGLNPNLLSSGKQPKEFYKDLWNTLLADGHWEGDVWNRKKTGEIFAEWLSISTVRDSQGNVSSYVAMFSDVTEKKKASDKILEYANYDPLTRLPNRRLFNDRLKHSIVKSHRSSQKFGLVFIDLDHFKEVNDELGHAAGDELLIEAANRIEGKVRAADTVARLGGDEFIVILNEIKNRSDLERVASSIVLALRETFFIHGKEVHVSGSLGLITYPDDASDSDTLIRGADKAMYKAKQSGKNCFRFYEK